MKKHHTVLLIAGAVGALYLFGKMGGASAAGVGAGGAVGPGGGAMPYMPYNGQGTPAAGFVNSIFGQFGQGGGRRQVAGGSPYGGLPNIPTNYYGSPTSMGSPMGSPMGSASGTTTGY